jgi:hypothetical protein
MEGLSGALGFLDGGIVGLVSTLGTLGKVLLTNPVLAIAAAIAAAALLIVENWDGIVEFFSGIFTALSAKFAEWKNRIFQMMPDWMKDWIGSEGADAPEESSPKDSGLKENALQTGAIPAKPQSRPAAPALPSLSALNAADSEIKNFGAAVSGGLADPAGVLFSRGAAQLAPLAPGSSVTNTYETNVGDVVVYTRGNDPAGVGREVAGALQRVVTNGNHALQGV